MERPMNSAEMLSGVEKRKNKYTYRDNSSNKHEIVFECEAASILQADELYEKQTVNDPKKQSYIGCSVNEKLDAASESKIDGEIIEKDGKRYRKIDSGYTIREYFSHHTSKKGPGPGWDIRNFVLDKMGFDPFADPSTLPDDPYYILEEIEDNL